MATKDQGPEIDTEVAPCTGQDAELKEAMQTLRQPKGDPSDSPPSTPKRRGRPKTPAKTQPSNPVAPAGQHTTTNEDVLADLVDQVDSKPDLKAEMTQRELIFLEIYLSGEHNIDKAMMLAGFEGYHTHSLYRLGRKIVQKYGHRGGDSRKILRAVGVGEVRVAKKILELMNDSSKVIQLRATELAAKVLGMSRESVEVAQGITIVIKGRDDAPARLAHGPQQGPPKAPPLTMAIIK